MDVALASVVATGAVGLAAVVPPLDRRAQRRHEDQVRIWDRRAVAYDQILRMMHLAAKLDDAANEQAAEAGIQSWLWGSREVRDAVFAWVDVYKEDFGPGSDDKTHRGHVEAANVVRQRMADELQGRIKIR